MKFSVIIPVYNSVEFLPKCLDSILTQDFGDFELILVNDGSGDNSGEICRAYAGKYDNVRAFDRENGGPSAARNFGIAQARGEYLTFVDSDDWVREDYFAVLSRVVAEDPDLVIFGRTHESNGELILTAFPEAALSGREQVLAYAQENYLRGDIASCVNKVYSRRLLEDGTLRFPEGTVVEEDLLFVLGAIDRSTSLRVIAEGLYCYNRREAGSVTTKYNPNKFDCKGRAYRAELEFARKWESLRLEEIFHDNYLSYISACINNLMYSACPLTRKQKLAEIRRFFRAEETALCAERSKGLSLRGRVMGILIRLRLYRVSYWMHYLIFRLRRTGV